MDDEPKVPMSDEERRELKKLALQGQFAETKLLGLIVVCIGVFLVVVYLQYKAIDLTMGWETFAALPIGRAAGRLVFFAFFLPPLTVAGLVFRRLKPRGTSWG
jgi:uncharacterized membrane protein HdeD (DUF308 family)